MCLSWAHFPVISLLLASVKMTVTVGELTLCWGDWKHSVEGVPTGHMKERSVVFERENRNPQETRLYFFLPLITVLS